jgi:hypothetical protein
MMIVAGEMSAGPERRSNEEEEGLIKGKQKAERVANGE